ncbi:MAG: hypothetical protein IPJ34_41920 [Myxococcales bacterium]|nr:hypothetical protein [Myxococcales bacterium]
MIHLTGRETSARAASSTSDDRVVNDIVDLALAQVARTRVARAQGAHGGLRATAGVAASGQMWTVDMSLQQKRAYASFPPTRIPLAPSCELDVLVRRAVIRETPARDDQG